MDSDSSDEIEVPKKVLKLKFNKAYDSIREVVFCEHKTTNPCPEKPLGRTLFLTKIPPWTTEDALIRIFETNGPITRVFLSKKSSSNLTEEEQRDYTGVNRFLFPPKHSPGFKFGYVVFDKPSSMRKAVNEMDLNHPYIVSTEEKPIQSGRL